MSEINKYPNFCYCPKCLLALPENEFRKGSAICKYCERSERDNSIARYNKLIASAYQVLAENSIKNMLEISDIYTKIQRYETILDDLEGD